MRARPRSLLLAVAVALIACGDGTGPDDVDLSGSWRYTAVLERDSRTCRVEDAVMSIEQSGDLIAGTIAMAAIECDGRVCEDAALDEVEVRFGTISDGQINFEAFVFDHEGTATADRMEGELVSERAEISGCVEEAGGGTGTEIIERGPGTWEATR